LKRSYKAEKRMDGKRQKGKMSKIRIWGEDEHIRLKLRVRKICTSIHFRFQHFYSSTFVLFLFSIFFLSGFFHRTMSKKKRYLNCVYMFIITRVSIFIFWSSLTNRVKKKKKWSSQVWQNSCCDRPSTLICIYIGVWIVILAKHSSRTMLKKRKWL
jgi:hypothetical protein